MSILRRWAWPLFTTVIVAVIGWFAPDAVADAMSAPSLPTTMTLSQVAKAESLPPWIELSDGQVRCDLAVRANGRLTVPLADGADEASTLTMLWISLEKDELCATLSTPLRVVVRNSDQFRQRVLDELRAQQAFVLLPIGRTVFFLEDDLPGERRVTVIFCFGLLFPALFALAFQLRGRLRRDREPGLRAVGGAGAAPAGGVLAAIVSGSTVGAGERVLPAAPLTVSAATTSMAFRRKHTGPAILVIMSIAMTGLGGYATVGIVNDLRAWHQGIEVPAEITGSTTTKLVFSVLAIQLAWQMPNETAVRHDARMFMTLWMADKEAGAVRALIDDPSVVTFEEAVDLVPFRIPLVLGLFAMAGAAVVSARDQRRRVDTVSQIAETAVEGRLEHPSIVTQMVNGAVTGHTLSGVLNGVEVSTVLLHTVNPTTLVIADDTGALLVACSADGRHFVPIRHDGEPFAWRGADLARAQAVLLARGSPSILVEPSV
jgi:hypothetical protein